MQLQGSVKEFSGVGLQVVAISYDGARTLKNFADKKAITFPLLSDPNSSVIDAYGIRNQEADGRAKSRGIPHPGTFLVDGKGTLRMKLGHEGFRKRHAAEALLKAAREMKAK